MKIKVLIVDDEKLIREGLKKIIEKIDDKFVIVGEAKNGLDALEKINQSQPDIAIIDIKMPIMDGLELLKRINQENLKVKMIILSGHDEFAYAKIAIENGAKAYILKPFEKSELTETLNRLYSEIVEERSIELQLKKTEVIKEKLLETEIKNIILEQIQGDNILEKLSFYKENIKEFEQSIYTILIKENPNNFNEEYSFLNMKKQIDSKLKEKNIKYISFYISNDSLVYLLNNLEPLEYFSKLKQSNLKVAVCDYKYNIYEIYQSFKNVSYAMKYTYLDKTNEIAIFSKINNKDLKYVIPKDYILKIRYLVGTEKFNECCSIIDKLFSENCIKYYAIEYFEETIKLIYQEVIEHLVTNIQKNISDFEELKRLDSLYNFNDIYDYRNKLLDILKSINNAYIKLKGIYKSQNELEKALDFINKNYYKDINMTIVANYVSLNYYYFSTLFKEHTKLSFIDYLNNVRINKAKELLNDSSLKIYEISERVGFKNPKHFARIFKNITGMTPAEYKEMLGLQKKE
ncbi:response regulator [Caldicellulosiruptoraceae bacterium PP1]